jgi:hypothetical protein
MSERCETCVQNERTGKSVSFKKKHTKCAVCQKEVRKVLDLHHTGADICSLKCEQKFWLDILY